MPEATPPPAPEFLERADAILRPAMALQDFSHPLVLLAHETGCQRLAAELAINLEAYRAVPIPHPPHGSGLPQVDIAIAAHGVSLPALPEVALKLRQVTADPESSARQVAEVITLDPSLSTALLHLVNSAFYGFPSPIDTIARAVAIVGTTQIHALAMGRMVLNMVGSLPPSHYDMAAFWEHSIACGVLARGLALLCGHNEPERAFLSGVLHDIGKLGIASVLPDHSQAVAELSRTEPEFEGERVVVGFGHGRFGGMILRKLDIPYSIVEAVANHHGPMRAKHLDGACLLHVADFLVRTLVVSSGGPPMVPPLDKAAWAHLGLEPDALRPLIAGLDQQLQELAGILTR